MGGEGLSSALPEGVEAREIGDRDEWLGWRKRNVNASEAACLWGDNIHPFMSAYRLWALKSGKVSDAEENAAMKRGRLLEPVAIELLKEQKRWHIARPGLYLQHKEWRIGATPDAVAWIYEENRQANIQIKTVGRYAFEKHWRDPDTREIVPPLWIAVQATIETLLSGVEVNYVAPLVVSDGGLLDLHVLPVPLRPGILTALIERAKDFWRRVALEDPYPVDYFKDADTVLEVYREEDGSEIDLSGDERVGSLIAQHGALSELIRAGDKAQKARKAVNAQLVDRMGNARYGRFGSTTINAGNIKRLARTVAASSYRFVRIREGK